MDCAYILILATLSLLLLYPCNPSSDQKLFRAYIGAESDSVKLSDVPISPGVEFHFILAFAIDYTNEKSPSPTDGKFKEFWETAQLTPAKIAAMKHHHKNVKVVVSLGGDSVGNGKVFFSPESIDTWVENAVSSLTTMIETYHLDGIDIDYEHFKSDPDTFAECIGKLVTELKQKQIISSASIAPYDDEQVQSHYMALWGKYGHVIDYVNFQFYAYDKLSVPKFISDFHKQASNYEGGRILASFTSNGHGGLGPKNGFFQACRELKKEGKLAGIFVWCADESKKFGFRGVKKAQHLLKFAYDLL